MIFKHPQAYSAVQRKYPSTPAIALGEKIVQVGNFSTKTEYTSVMQNLLKQYPRVKETDFVFTFIFSKKPYIV